MEKCISCEEKINTEEDYYNYTCDDKIICEDCYNSDLDYASTIIDNEGKKYYKGSYTLIDENGEDYNIPNNIKEYANNIEYKQTDGWRGYSKGKSPKNYKCIEDRWFSGFDGFNMSDLMENFHNIIEDDREFLSGFDYFYGILLTSNVFSQNFELYIKEDQAEEFINRINNY